MASMQRRYTFDYLLQLLVDRGDLSRIVRPRRVQPMGSHESLDEDLRLESPHLTGRCCLAQQSAPEWDRRCLTDTADNDIETVVL